MPKCRRPPWSRADAPDEARSCTLALSDAGQPELFLLLQVRSAWTGRAPCDGLDRHPRSRATVQWLRDHGDMRPCRLPDKAERPDPPEPARSGRRYSGHARASGPEFRSCGARGAAASPPHRAAKRSSRNRPIADNRHRSRRSTALEDRPRADGRRKECGRWKTWH